MLKLLFIAITAATAATAAAAAKAAIESKRIALHDNLVNTTVVSETYELPEDAADAECLFI